MTKFLVRNGENGFALIEVLVAFTILSLFLAVSFEGLMAALRANQRSEGMRRALFQAESKLDAIGMTEPIESGEASGTFQDGAMWTTIIRELPHREANLPRAFWVLVTVSDANFSEQRASITLRTLKITDGNK